MSNLTTSHSSTSEFCGRSYCILGCCFLVPFLLMERIISLTSTLHLAAKAESPRQLKTCMYFQSTGDEVLLGCKSSKNSSAAVVPLLTHRDSNERCSKSIVFLMFLPFVPPFSPFSFPPQPFLPFLHLFFAVFSSISCLKKSKLVWQQLNNIWGISFWPQFKVN